MIDILIQHDPFAHSLKPRLRLYLPNIMTPHDDCLGVPSKAMCEASSTKPESRPEKVEWIQHSVFQQVKEMVSIQSSCDILFVGDSLTEALLSAPDVMNSYFGSRKVYNAGKGGETAQGILYRLQHWPDALRPRVIVFMIGANNVDYKTDEIAAGTIACVRRMEEKWPNAMIILVGMPPRGLNPEEPLCKNVVAVNAMTCKIADMRKIFYLSLHESFTYRGDNHGFEGVGPDTLHLAPEGYALWARAMEPLLARLLGESGQKYSHASLNTNPGQNR